MRIKKLGAVLFAAAALGTVLASNASAAATTTDVQWYTGAAPGTLLSGSATLNTSLVGTAVLSTNVGGVPIVLEATGVECAGCIVENVSGAAVGSGKLKWTGVSVQAPSTCTVSSTITTDALTFKADYMVGTTDYILLEPTAGSGAAFMSFSLSGISCPLQATIVHKGTLFGQFANATGTQATSQTVDFSGTINSTAGGTTHVGAETATVEGSIAFSLASGAAFGTH